jgi:hypothetical protein
MKDETITTMRELQLEELDLVGGSGWREMVLRAGLRAAALLPFPEREMLRTNIINWYERHEA